MADKKNLNLGGIGVGKVDAGRAVEEVEMVEASGNRSFSTPAARGRSTTVASRSVNPLKRMKRKGGEDVGSESEGVSVCASPGIDELCALKSIGLRMRKYVFADANRVSKAMSEFLLGCVSDYEEQMMRMMVKNERLQGRLDECEKVMRDRTFASVRGVSYAAVAASGENVGGPSESVSAKGRAGAGVTGRATERTYAVVVKAKDDNAKWTSEQVKSKVMKEVSGVLDVRVKAVRKTRSGGVAIKAASANDLQRLRECKRFDEVGLRVDSPRKVGPKVIVYDVPNDMPEEEFMKEVYVKNVCAANQGVSESDFRERARIVSRVGRKGMDVGNVVLEVSKRVRDILVSEGRMYVKWRACRVREFLNVLRCHKCLAFGHMMRECTEKERLCERCCESGHLRDKCRKESVCRNCKLKGRKADHSVLSPECPEYVRMLERERMRINDD